MIVQLRKMTIKDFYNSHALRPQRPLCQYPEDFVQESIDPGQEEVLWCPTENMAQDSETR